MHFSSAVVCVGTETAAILKHIERAIPQNPQPLANYLPIRAVNALEGRALLPFEICRHFQVVT